MTKQFEVGQSYATRSACDHDCIYAYKIERRTAKSVWIEIEGKVERRTINTYSGVETFKPHGRYSMSATIMADRAEDDVRVPDRRRADRAATAPVVEALKASTANLTVALVDRRFDRATRFFSKFAGPCPQTDKIRFMLNAVSIMTDEDFAELAEIRNFLQGN